MDITSYLLGKNASGGGGGGVDEYFNTTIELDSGSPIQPIIKGTVKKMPNITLANNYTNLANAFAYCKALEIAPNINTENVTDMDSMFYYCVNLTQVPNYNTVKVTNMNTMFRYCNVLETAPQFNLENVTNTSNMFAYCGELKNVPQYNFSSLTTYGNMFRYCAKLTDESLDNILVSCTTATSITSSKTLSGFGITSTYYPASRIQALPHYQDFIDAGWSIGY